MLLLVTSCNYTGVEKNKQSTKETRNQTIAEDKAEPIKPTIKWDSKLIIGEAVLWRQKTEKNEAWSKVDAVNVSPFSQEISVGSKLQIIPLTSELNGVELSIVEVQTDETDEGMSYFAKLEDIKDASYKAFNGPADRSDEFPCDLLVLYPSIPSAKLLDKTRLNSNDLPGNIKPILVKAALDFDGDQKADALVLQFCCKNRMYHENCDLFCTETYLRIDSQWVMTDASQAL